MRWWASLRSETAEQWRLWAAHEAGSSGECATGLLAGWRTKRVASGALQVADCCVEALVEAGASNKVVEIIAKPENPRRPYTELFASV